MTNSGTQYYGLLVAALFTMNLYADSPVRTPFPDFESYTQSLSVAIKEQKTLDLNRDGKPDYMVYTANGEQLILDILLSSTEGYTAWRLPVAEGYVTGITPDGTEIQLRYETFPEYGNMVGGDIHPWYDFYAVTGDALVLQNTRHKPFFRSQRTLYQKRIQELQQQRERMVNETGQDDTRALIELHRNAETVKRYLEWVERADRILADAPEPLPATNPPGSH
jgi:hypothetical protein